MSKDRTFRDAWLPDNPHDITIAIPDNPVRKFQELVDDKALDHEVRTKLRKAFNNNYSLKVELSEKWGHAGFAVPYDDFMQFWMVFNPDKQERNDYVLVTVYTDDQFKKRMVGSFFSDLDLSNAKPERLRQIMTSGGPPMQYRVECAGKAEEFDSEEACLRHLEALAAAGHTQRDWQVWKRVKTGVSVKQ